MNEAQIGAAAAPAFDAGAGGIRQRFFPDYNAAATLYWAVLVAAGVTAAGFCALRVSLLSSANISQVLAIGLVAAVVGMFPLHPPKTKVSIAAGDIFIFLLLLLHGTEAAVVGAVMESAVCVLRTSRRWSSRIASPAAAAVAMLACGYGFEGMVASLARAGIAGDGVMFGAVMLLAASYFVVSPTLVAIVIYLKREQWPSLVEWLKSFGWLGLSYAASASVAAVLYLAFPHCTITSPSRSPPSARRPNGRIGSAPRRLNARPRSRRITCTSSSAARSASKARSRTPPSAWGWCRSTAVCCEPITRCAPCCSARPTGSAARRSASSWSRITPRSSTRNCNGF
jgi:hypothetical protein